jgi:hypothetical protein
VIAWHPKVSAGSRPASRGGADIGETSVSKYMVRRRKPPSQVWKIFLENHLKSIVSVGFTVPTIRFQILYVLLVLAHDRRRILHVAVTVHPTAKWDDAATVRGIPMGQRAAASCYATAIGSSVPTLRHNSRTRGFGRCWVRPAYHSSGRTSNG